MAARVKVAMNAATGSAAKAVGDRGMAIGCTSDAKTVKNGRNNSSDMAVRNTMSRIRVCAKACGVGDSPRSLALA